VDVFGGPVSPEYSVEFLYPFAFSYVQTFAQVDEDGVVADFSLAVALWVRRRGESMGDLVLSAEASYLLTRELHSIIRDDGVEEPKVTHYVLPEEN